MKNANVFLAFILLILLLYPISIYSYNTSKKIDLSKEPVYITNFSYTIIENKGDEIYLEGDNLTKSQDQQVIEKLRGYYIDNRNKRIDFKADLVTNYQTENKIELEKNILVAESNNYLETNKIIFNQKSNTIFGPENIKMVFDNSLIEGRDLVYDLSNRKITLKKIRGKLWLSKLKF